jgi:Tol biopolymer transport system component
MTRPRVLVAALAVAAVVVPGVEARAVFPGRPDVLAFSSQGNIFTIAPDGSPPLRQLTFDGASHHPRWSPTGDRIAFDRGGDIYVMSSSGTDVRRLTTFGRSSEPAWAPGGKRLVFVHRKDALAPGDLWTVPLSGGGPSRLTYQGTRSCELGHPSWSPLGGRIAYQWQRRTDDGGCTPTRVVVMRIDPRERRVIGSASAPDFTADGKGIFFASRLDPVDGSFWPSEQLSWSNLFGGQRERLTSLFCAEGDPCFVDGVGAPDSVFPAMASNAVLFSRLGGSLCIVTTSAGGFCNTAIPVVPSDLDWRSIPEA